MVEGVSLVIRQERLDSRSPAATVLNSHKLGKCYM